MNYEIKNLYFKQWLAGEGQCVAGVAVNERGGIVRADAVRVG